MKEHLTILNPNDLLDSSQQYRTKLGDISDMVESARARGIIEPVMVRVVQVKGVDRYELVFGHRRKAAAIKAGLTEIMAIVRQLTDDEVLELQVIENSQREDPHPVDEARGFAELVKRGHSIGYVAARIGRPPSYVAQRIKLMDLSKACLKALNEQAITLAVAHLIARIPSKDLQDRALEDLIGDRWDQHGRPIPVAEARELIEANYMLRLAGAPWKLDDEELVARVGPCTTCPKRTGTQTELFADASSPDLCTDPGCYRLKLDAVWKLRKKTEAENFAELLEGEAAAKALRYGGGYKQLDREEYCATTGDVRKVRKLIGKEKPPITLAQDPETGQHVELVREADFERIVRGQAKARGKTTRASDSLAESQKREERKLKLRRKAILLAIDAAVEKAPRLPQEAILGLVVRAFAARVWNEIQRAILDRRGIEVKAGDVEKTITRLAKTCADVPGDLAGLGLELAMRSGAPWHQYANGTSEWWRDALKLAGVDFAKLEKQIVEEAKAKKVAKGKKGSQKRKVVGGVVHRDGKKKPTKKAATKKTGKKAGHK